MFGTGILEAALRPEAPNLSQLGSFEYDPFDFYGELASGVDPSIDTANRLNEANVPGGVASRNSQLTGLSSLAEQLMSGGLTTSQRDEIGQSNAELSALGFGGGTGSGIDALRGLRMRTDTIQNNQLKGATLATSNVNILDGILADPMAFLQGGVNSARQDYNFGRDTEYQKMLTNFGIDNQNKAIDFSNDLAGDLGYAFATDLGDTVDWAANTPSSLCGGGGGAAAGAASKSGASGGATTGASAGLFV